MEYKCHTCGVTGVKLWRSYTPFLSNVYLECVDCACLSQKKDASTVKEDGTRLTSDTYQPDFETDQIGWMIPAVKDGDTFWNYGTTHESALLKWKKLPLRKQEDKYKCSVCGVTGVKLWRNIAACAQAIDVYCVDCIGEKEKVDVSMVDAWGCYIDPDLDMRTDQIGGMIPCVMVDDTFYHYSAVPKDEVEKWRNLPLRKKKE